MAIPTNHKHILPFMFPNAEQEAWEVYDSPAGLAFFFWDAVKAGGAEPTEQEIIGAGNSQAFDDHMNVPKEVTNYQLKRALNTVPADRAAVDALVAGADQDTQDGWNNALSFKSDNPLFAGAIAVLGWSQEKVNSYLKLAITFK